MQGRIKTLKESFGFITPDAGGKVFFRFRDVKGVEFTRLEAGMRVEYEARSTDRGMSATVVRVVASADAPGSEGQPPSDAGYRFLNPYNFVRPLQAAGAAAEPERGTALGEAPRRIGHGAASAVESAEIRLMGRTVPPPHDRFVGLQGRIVCELTAETALFVSDSEDVRGRGRQHRSYRFFRYGGEPAIPGSSLRGMVRSVFEAVTNSCFSVFDGRRLSKRADPAEARALWPARVVSANGRLALEIMNGATPFDASGPRQGERLPAAWLLSYTPIRRSPTLRDPANAGTPYASRTIVQHPLEHRDSCWALISAMQRPDSRSGTKKGFPFWNVEAVATDRAQLPEPAAGQRIVEGWLCITNRNIENKHDERFFFSDGKGPAPLHLSEDVLRAYKDLIADYCARHAAAVDKRRAGGGNAGEAAGGGRDPDLSRFIREDPEALKEGDLVYARVSGSATAPRVEYVVPVSVPRVTYQASLRDVLERTARHLLRCDDYEKLCPACRTFGWVRAETAPEDVARVASRGRVRIRHALLTRPAGAPFEATLAILSSPKPTTVAFYLERRTPSDARWSPTALREGYDGDVALRGRKFYRHHGEQGPAQPTPSGERHEFQQVDGRGNDQNRTVRDALPAGNVFSFEIAFENLAEVELGALLWTLEMDGRGCHRLGFAKSLGFGSVRLTVTHVEVVSPAERYSTLATSGAAEIHRDRWMQWVEGFKTALGAAHGAGEFERLLNVTDLRAILGDPPGGLPVHYPRPHREPSADGENFEWFVVNKKAGAGHPLAPPAADTGLPLLNKDGA